MKLALHYIAAVLISVGAGLVGFDMLAGETEVTSTNLGIFLGLIGAVVANTAAMTYGRYRS